MLVSRLNGLKQERYEDLERCGSSFLFFRGVEREKKRLKYYQRFDSSAVGQEKKVQHKKPQRNWVFTSFLHLKLLHSKKEY